MKLKSLFLAAAVAGVLAAPVVVLASPVQYIAVGAGHAYQVNSVIAVAGERVNVGHDKYLGLTVAIEDKTGIGHKPVVLRSQFGAFTLDDSKSARILTGDRVSLKSAAGKDGLGGRDMEGMYSGHHLALLPASAFGSA